MKVLVRLFARAKDLAGADRLELEVDADATVGQLRRRLVHAYPQLQGLLERSAIAVNEEFAADDRILRAGETLALLPPVSGGGS